MSLRMHGTDSELLPAILKDDDIQTPLQRTMSGTTDRVVGLMAERDELIVRLDKYNVSKKNLERKVFEEEVIIRSMTGSMKQLERKVSSSRDEINLLQKTNEEVTVIYDEEKTVLRKRITKVAKSVSTLMIRIVMCVSKTTLKWCTRELSKLKHIG